MWHNSVVAIVGRPNVGKSTLFNRLLGKRKAIVADLPGTTRDRHYDVTDWNGHIFTLIDTGGYLATDKASYTDEICQQVRVALEEATAILFVLDVTVGITDYDADLARLLRKLDKPVLVVANKVDNHALLTEASTLHALGMGEVYPIAAIDGSGTGELLDALVTGFPVSSTTEESNTTLPRLALIGKPNVGKSTMVNALLGTERSIVSDSAHTTRDATDSYYQAYGKEFTLIDTAGIGRKKKVDTEFYAVMRAMRAVQDCDVCMVLIDASQAISGQDLRLVELAWQYKKGVVLLANKWDLVGKSDNTMAQHNKELRARLGKFGDTPILYTSGLTKQRIHKAIEVALQVYTNRLQRLATPKLNEVLQLIVGKLSPPAVRGKRIRLKYMTQLPTLTPIFAIFTNAPQHIPEEYKRYLEKQLRKHYDFQGVPLGLVFKKSS